MFIHLRDETHGNKIDYVYFIQRKNRYDSHNENSRKTVSKIKQLSAHLYAVYINEKVD